MTPRAAVAFAVRAGLLFAGVAPFLPAWLARVPSLRPSGALLGAWFAFQCERDPARMLGFGAVCARCLGLYVGLGLGTLVGARRVPARWLERWVALGVVAMLIDVASEALGWRPAWAPLRVATGLALGFPAAALVDVALGAWVSGSRARALVPGRAAQKP